MHAQSSPHTKPFTPGLDGARKLLSEETANPHASKDEQLDAMINKLESRLVEATWVLRRLPDRERGFLSLSTMVWPDSVAGPADYAPQAMTSFQARRRARIDPKEIDRMQPTLDLLGLLPDITDRQILFWAAWHQGGERQTRLPWAKVRRSLGLNLSRWTLKRRYENGLRWLASIILTAR